MALLNHKEQITSNSLEQKCLDFSRVSMPTSAQKRIVSCLILMPLAFGWLAAAKELKITFWIEAGQKDIYGDIVSTLKVFDSLMLDVHITDAVLVLTDPNQEANKQPEVNNNDENMLKLCEILGSEGIAIVIDWSYQVWQPGIDLVRELGIPYLKVDRILRPFLDLFSEFMRQKRANNVAMIFQNERDKLEAMLHIVNGYSFRTMILNANEPEDFVKHLKALRPSPAYYGIFARGIHMSSIFERINKGLLFERAAEWHFVYLDPRDRLFKYKKQVERAMRFTMSPRTLCRTLRMKDDYCQSGFTFQRGMLLDLMRTLADIARGSDYLEPFVGDCNASIEAPPALAIEPLAHFDPLEYGLSNFMIYKNGPADGDSRNTMTNENELPLLSFNVTVNIDFYSNQHEAVTRLATWQAGELHRVNKTISPAKRFFRVGTAFAQPWSFYRLHPKSGEVLRDARGEPIWEGYCIDFVEALSRKMNFDYQIVGPTRGHLGKLDENGRWDGVVGDLVNGETDFAVAALKMYSEREEVIDFLPPYFDQTGISIVMRKPERVTSLFKFMTVLRLEVWLSIIVAIVVTALLTWFMDRFSPYSSRNNRDAYPYACREFTLRESIWFSLTSFTPQGGGEAPKAISGRILVAAYWLFVVLMLATFTANLAAFLTVERMQSPVQSLEQLARQSRINYTVVRDSDTHQYFMNMKFAEDTLYRMWKELALNASKDFKKFRVWDYPIKEQYGKILLAINSSMPVVDAVEGFLKVDEHLNADYAFIHDSAEIKYEVTRNCNFTEVGEVFAEQPYAVAVQQGSHLADELSYSILELQKERLFENLRDKYWNISARDNCPVPDGQEGITLDSLGGVFLATLLGLVIAMITLAIEVAYYKRKHDQRTLNAKIKQVKPVKKKQEQKTKIWHVGSIGVGKIKVESPPSFEVATSRSKKTNVKATNIVLSSSEFKPLRHGLQSRRELGAQIGHRRGLDGYLE